MWLSFIGSKDKTKHSENVYLKENHIYFRSSVSEKNINKLYDLITEYNTNIESLKTKHHLKSLVPKPIYLHIMTTGGSIQASLYGYDIIKNSKVPIYTIIEGHTYSGGTILLLAGKKRFATQNATLLIHNISSQLEGTPKQINYEITRLKIFTNKMKKIYLENTKIKKSLLNKYFDGDHYIDIQKCLQLGIVDEIYE